jgi:hypothetical protein
MKTIKVADLLDGAKLPVFFESLYVWRDGAGYCLYVGITRRSIVNRLQEHLGINGCDRLPSSVGKFVLSGLPQSREWLIEIYMPSELIHLIPEDIVSEIYRLNGSSKSIEEIATADFMEGFVIDRLKPRFNVIGVGEAAANRNYRRRSIQPPKWTNATRRK